MRAFLSMTFLRASSTEIISLALVTEEAHQFYAEFTDYNKAQATQDSWLRENVLNNLILNDIDKEQAREEGRYVIDACSCDDTNLFSGDRVYVRGPQGFIAEGLEQWLSSFYQRSETSNDGLEVWCTNVWDNWPLFLAIADGAQLRYPRGVAYNSPLDMHTFFSIVNTEANTNCEAFVLRTIGGVPGVVGMDIRRHNALYDALVLRACFKVLHDDLFYRVVG